MLYCWLFAATQWCMSSWVCLLCFSCLQDGVFTKKYARITINILFEWYECVVSINTDMAFGISNHNRTLSMHRFGLVLPAHARLSLLTRWQFGGFCFFFFLVWCHYFSQHTKTISTILCREALLNFIYIHTRMYGKWMTTVFDLFSAAF